MTSVEFSDDVIDTLTEIAKSRGLNGPEEALEEAIGVERQIALGVSMGHDVLITTDHKAASVIEINLSKPV